MTTAAQILDFCLAKNADVSFDRRGVVRILDGGELMRLENASQLAGILGTAPATARTTAGVTLAAPGYDSLADVLHRAFQQASEGKGKERHANSRPFDQQPMQALARAHGVGFLTGQACKKAEESLGLKAGRDIAELLGAINYLAGAVIFLESCRQVANDSQSDLDRFIANRNG